MYRLTEQADFLLGTLTWKVHALTIDQASRIVHAQFGEPDDVTRDLYHLQQAGLIDSASLALVLVEPGSPLESWSPNQSSQGPVVTCSQLERRWRTARTRRVTVCWATQEGAHLYGGIAGFVKNSAQIEHDLGTAAILSRLHCVRSHAASNWLGELILRRDFARRVKWLKRVPDAAILSDGRVTEFIEFAGQYPTRKLERFRNHCRRLSIPYSIW